MYFTETQQSVLRKHTFSGGQTTPTEWERPLEGAAEAACMRVRAPQFAFTVI